MLGQHVNFFRLLYEICVTRSGTKPPRVILPCWHLPPVASGSWQLLPDDETTFHETKQGSYAVQNASCGHLNICFVSHGLDQIAP